MRGLYGLRSRALKENKDIHEKANIYDYLGKLELAANLFRLDMTIEVIKRNNYKETTKLKQVFFEVGQKVRTTFFSNNGIKIENLPIEANILSRKIKSIKIEKCFSIKDIKIEKLSDKKEIYFLGENGVGKTIFLQAILNSLKNNKFENIISYAKLEGEQKRINFLYSNIFAYGVGRLRTHDHEIDETGYATLFDKQNVNLKNPIAWLKDVERLELKKIGNLKLEVVINMLTDILNEDGQAKIKIEQQGADFIFKEQGTSIKFSQLADGYRSILLILADLLMRFSENQPDISEIKNFKGIVLIDEVDMLLHPKLAYSLVKKLRKKLPNIQWFFTTHSPTLIMGASEDAIFYKLYKENGNTKISEVWTNNDIKHLMANGLITSPLFGMPNARMRELKNTGNLDTSSNFWVGKINEKIKEQVKKEEDKGKAYFSKKEINEFVESAINEIDEEGKND